MTAQWKRIWGDPADPHVRLRIAMTVAYLKAHDLGHNPWYLRLCRLCRPHKDSARCW